MLKVSIITVVLNNKSYIEDCIQSVITQKYQNCEYIIIDGASTDGTVDIIRKYDRYISTWISEPDQGMYDAMNKGIKLSSGDVVGMLNADDWYTDNNVISTVAEEFRTKNVDSIFADLVFVKRETPQQITRYCDSSLFSTKRFAYGWMPAHPTFFVKRIFYEKYGLFKTDYEIAADFELLVRMLGNHKISYSYMPDIIVKMRMGGLSTKSLKSNWILNKEIIRACTENGISTNYLKVYSKYFTKISQLFRRPE
jgi:glycosyltransferase involved in cell wall biosynthesis